MYITSVWWNIQWCAIVYLFPVLGESVGSMTEICHGSVYTMETGKYCKPELDLLCCWLSGFKKMTEKTPVKQIKQSDVCCCVWTSI